MEVRMADPNFILLSTHLPQFLNHMQAYITTNAFIRHCNAHMPRLGECLSKLPLEKVTQALTAKSCTEEGSYEKLEWLGDAVLKLVQTDSLLQSKDLSQWIEFLHEGDLSILRSGEWICLQSFIYLAVRGEALTVFSFPYLFGAKSWGATIGWNWPARI
jgi:dsRNA-specific ribonuclease